jgi:hypothetical protein
MVDVINEPKTRDERIAELLGKSGADAVQGIKGPSLGDLATDDLKTDTKVEDVVDTEDTETGGKKVRIPASRLKTLTSKVSELEAQVSETQSLKERLAILESQSNKDDDLPQWWKDAYGDNELSKQGYKNQQRIMREEMQRAMMEQEQQRQVAETRRNEQVQLIEQSFDEQMDDLEEALGRDLTATQKAELLDIVGEYSPMDGDKYVAYMPVSKAYDIWQKGQGNAGKQEIARIAGSQSSGSASPQVSSERPQMGDWRKRFGL